MDTQPCIYVEGIYFEYIIYFLQSIKMGCNSYHYKNTKKFYRFFCNSTSFFENSFLSQQAASELLFLLLLQVHSQETYILSDRVLR